MRGLKRYEDAEALKLGGRYSVKIHLTWFRFAACFSELSLIEESAREADVDEWVPLISRRAQAMRYGTLDSFCSVRVHHCGLHFHRFLGDFSAAAVASAADSNSKASDRQART
jgi:hypothetical protein